MDWKLKQEMRASSAKVLQDSFPHLVPVVGYNGLVVGAKNIRKELKAAFPGVKFSVRSESYAGGNSIRVSWVDADLDGKEVDKIVGKYEEGKFNSMEDIYDYSDSVWNDAFGGAKYVFASFDKYGQ